ncbi:hypothetical protein [Streptomyces sp. NPDC093269]|uniref:hypothetical protein n=1 Tax=Streptomyces sp. NPDC093269 TaxID=3366038 RepID=UPI00381B88FB
MFRRRESVPFAFLAGNIAPPPRERATRGQMAGRWLMGLTIVAGLVGALVIGMPSLQQQSPAPTQHSEASDGR